MFTFAKPKILFAVTQLFIMVDASTSEKNDLHVYDPALMSWIGITFFVGTPPPARRFFGFTCAGSKLFVNGGTSLGVGRWQVAVLTD